MFAQPQNVYHNPTPRRFRTRCGASKNAYTSMHTLSDKNSRSISEIKTNKPFHILAFEKNGVEGIYSIAERHKNGVEVNHIVAFHTFDEAFRYKTLLEADTDFNPFIQFVSKYELNHACNVGNYKCRVVNRGTLVVPPSKTLEITDWEKEMDM